MFIAFAVFRAKKLIEEKRRQKAEAEKQVQILTIIATHHSVKTIYT